MVRDLKQDLHNQVLGTINRFLIVDLHELLWDPQIVEGIQGSLVIGGRSHDPLVKAAIAVYMGSTESDKRNKSVYNPTNYGYSTALELYNAIYDLMPSVQPYARLDPNPLIKRDL